MNAPANIFSLSPQVARQVYQFIFSPATDAEPSKLAAIVPAGLDPASPCGARALRTSLGLDDPVLDLSRVEHRLALLPREGLGVLARFVAIGLLAWPIRRVIRKAEFERLASSLSEAEWAYVMSRSERDASATSKPGANTPDGHTLADQIDQAGWAEIDAASHALPQPIGFRLRLKLPQGRSGSVTAQVAGLSLERALDAYESAVLAWRPHWDQQFTAPHARGL